MYGVDFFISKNIDAANDNEGLHHYPQKLIYNMID